MDNILTKYCSFWICLALVLITAVVFYQVCTYDFVDYDDQVYVYENPNIQTDFTLKAIKWAFSANRSSNWHPLTWLSHMLDWQLFGLAAGGHHCTNLVFHIANTLLLFIVLKQMTHRIWPSAFVAALFALHPLHVESIAWVSERKDVLSTFFWMLTMWAYFRFVGRPKISSYLLVVIFFALGLTAKPMLVTLPFVLLLLDYWPLERIGPTISPKNGKAGTKYSLFYLLIEKVPLFAMAAASCIVTYTVQQKGSGLVLMSLKLRIFNALVSYVEYIGKMIWPVHLAVFYPHPGQNVSIPNAIISAIFLLAVAILVLRFAKSHRYLVTGWFWYIGTLVPVIGLIQVGEQAIADRYTYITLTGLFIIIAWGLPELLRKWPHRKIILWISSLAVLTALATLTYLQQQYWKNTLTLFERALKVTDNNYQAHFCISNTLLKQGRIEEAIRHSIEGVRINPNHANAVATLGVALSRAGRIDEAIDCFKRAIEIRPNFANAHFNLAVVLITKGRLDEAVSHYRIALETMDTISLHRGLGYALFKLGRFEEAAAEYRKVQSAMPNNLEVLNKLGYALAQTGQFDEAIEEYQKSLQIKPDDTNVLNALGIALSRQGKFGEAIKCFTEILRIKPDSASVHTNIGYALILQGKFDEATVHLTEALRLDPNFARAHYYLGQILAQREKLNEAVTHFEETIRLRPGWAETIKDLAWLLAARQETTIHNPEKAIRFAQRACELTNYKRPEFLDTLAVAYAAAGDFSKAIEIGEKALELCQSSEQNMLKEKIENRLVLYKAGKPYIETP